MLVKDLLNKKGGEVLVIDENITVQESARVMVERKVGSALISLPDGNFGILTERDVLRLCAAKGGEVAKIKVGEVMTTDLRTASPETTVEDIIRQMTEHRFRHMPIIEDGKLVGIVSIGDIVKTRLVDTEHEVSSLKNYMFGPGHE